MSDLKLVPWSEHICLTAPFIAIIKTAQTIDKDVREHFVYRFNNVDDARTDAVREPILFNFHRPCFTMKGQTQSITQYLKGGDCSTCSSSKSAIFCVSVGHWECSKFNESTDCYIERLHVEQV